MPSLRNLQLYVFHVLPSRYVFGSLQIGGNCIIFTPQPQLRSVELLQSGKLKSQAGVQILTDNVEKIALTDDVKIPRPSRLQLLRALGRTATEFPAPCVTVPSPAATTQPVAQRLIDIELLEETIEGPEETFLDAIDKLGKQAVDPEHPRYLVLRTFKGDQFHFLGPTESLRQLHQELMEFVMKCNCFNQHELIHSTSGTEGFEFLQIEPPSDQKKVVEKITRDGQNQFGLFARRAVRYHKKLPPPKKVSGAEQILMLQKKQQREVKRQTNTKKFQTSNTTFEAKFEPNQHYKRFGNLIADQPIQQLWTNVLGANKFELPDVINAAQEPSTSDLVIPLKTAFDPKSEFKLSREIAKHAASGHQQSQSLFDEGLSEALAKCKQAEVKANANTAIKKRSECFLGRASIILTDDELRQVKRFLPPKYDGFKAFVQYQTATDGRYLTNLYNSYDMTFKESFNMFVGGMAEEDKEHAEEMKKYNLQLDRASLSLTNIQLLLVSLKGGETVVVCNLENPKIGRFGTKETFILVKYGNEFTQFKVTGKNTVYLVKEQDKLIIGSNGSALVLFQDLLKAATAPCDTYGSPALFNGTIYEKFTEGDIEEVEIIRFVVGE